MPFFYRHLTAYIMASVCLCFNTSAHTSQILETTLSNGLHVMIKPDHRTPLAMVQVWYRVGGVDEPRDQLGISHVLEHMMFKGTIRVPKDELKQLNRRFGGSLNAFTSHNYTYYYQVYPIQQLPLALELEADRMSGLFLQYKDFATEIKVVMEERRQRTEDNPQNLAFEKFRQTAFPLTPYQSPVIGYMHHLQNIELKDLQQWYQTWYAPNNASVVIVGDVDPQYALHQVQRFFGDIPAKALPTRVQLKHPTDIGYRHVNFQQNTEVPNLYMGWNVPSLSTASHHKDAYSLMLLKHLLAGNASSRIHRQLIQQDKVLTTANIGYDFIQRGDTLFNITAIPTQGISLSIAQQKINALLEDLKTNLITHDELEQVKTQVIAQHIYSQDTLTDQAQLLGNLYTNGLDVNLSQKLPHYYQEITPQDIQQVVQKYFDQKNLTTLYLQKQFDDIPADSRAKQN